MFHDLGQFLSTITMTNLLEALLSRDDKGLFFLKALIVVSGMVAFILGAMVLLGWHTHNVTLIQIDPAYVPMQYNTALGFVLSGAGLVTVVFNKSRITFFTGILIAAIGLLTLSEYIFAINIGLDQLFMQHYITVKTSTPGRMAPNTALCFSIIGLTLFSLVFVREHRWLPILTGVTGALLLGLSLVAFTGYLMGVETAFGWGALTRMAIHTSLGFIVLSCGFLVLTWFQGVVSKSSSLSESRLINTLSVPVGIGVLTVTVLLWQALQNELGRNIVHDKTYLNLVLVFGTLLAIAIAWAINRAFAEQVQARLAQVARQALELDIQSRQQAEEALRESEQRFRSIFENAAIGIAQISTEGRYLQVNEAFCNIVGYSSHEILTQNITSRHLTYPDDLPADLKQLANMLETEGNSYSLEKRYIKKDGNIAWVHLSVFLMRDQAKAPMYFISAGQDITERKALQLTIERQAQVDYLTGLSNRRHFIDEGEAELARAIRYKKPLSLMMLDIDFFKLVNDTYGHKTGDFVLQRISGLFKEALREIDIIGRLGGEEFAILLPETDLDKAIEVAERVRELIESSEIALEIGLPLHATVSIGVTTLMNSEINIDMLLHQADQALYESKKTGRNKVCIAS